MALTEQPTSLTHLAEQLINHKFNRITSIAELLQVDSAKNFLDWLGPGDACISPNFITSMPVVYENVSVKKYDYTLLTHVIFWLADGEPYIYTPPATVGFTRHGMKYNKLNRGNQLTIASNVKAFDVLAVSQRCEHDHEFDKPEKSLSLSITRYVR